MLQYMQQAIHRCRQMLLKGGGMRKMERGGTIVDVLNVGGWDSHRKVQPSALVAQNSAHHKKGISDLPEALLPCLPPKFTKRIGYKTESEIPSKENKFDNPQGIVHNAST